MNPKALEGCVCGETPEFYVGNTSDICLSKLDSAIDSILSKEIVDIVILTCKTETTSLLVDKCRNGKYRSLRFTTVRKFKGLEADAVILIDIDTKTFENDDERLIYVGASRARLYLSLVCMLSQEQSLELYKRYGGNQSPNNSYKALAASLGGMLK